MNSISPVDSNAKNVYVFNGNPSSIFGGIATYVAKVLRVKSVSVVYPQDAQSVAGAQALGSALKSVGVTAKSVGFDSFATDLTAPLVAAGAGSTGGCNSSRVAATGLRVGGAGYYVAQDHISSDFRRLLLFLSSGSCGIGRPISEVDPNIDAVKCR